jgi:hypothetical protein
MGTVLEFNKLSYKKMCSFIYMEIKIDVFF